MKTLSKILVVMGLAIMGSFTWSYNPCSWEVSYVRRINNDLHIMVNANMGIDEINRKERQLSGALHTLDLCLVAHHMM